MIAALYVMPRGPYSLLPSVDAWDEARDARGYAGPWPVVAHPPCARWGRYWQGGPSARVKLAKGADGGCFEAALAAARRFGGVLEHPADSSAWAAFGLNAPPRAGGWIKADDQGGWTCCVDQAHYGHRAQKATWLYAVGCALPDLLWGKARSTVATDGLEPARRRQVVRRGVAERLSHRQRASTPAEFRDLLLSIARTAEVAPA